MCVRVSVGMYAMLCECVVDLWMLYVQLRLQMGVQIAAQNTQEELKQVPTLSLNRGTQMAAKRYTKRAPKRDPFGKPKCANAL